MGQPVFLDLPVVRRDAASEHDGHLLTVATDLLECDFETHVGICEKSRVPTRFGLADRLPYRKATESLLIRAEGD